MKLLDTCRAMVMTDDQVNRANQFVDFVVQGCAAAYNNTDKEYAFWETYAPELESRTAYKYAVSRITSELQALGVPVAQAHSSTDWLDDDTWCNTFVVVFQRPGITKRTFVW